MKFDIKITGMEEVFRKIDSLPKKLSQAPIKAALEAATVPVLDAIETNTPVETGELKAALTHDIQSGEYLEGATSRISFGDGIEGEIARWVEFGHRTVTGVSKKALEDGLLKLKIEKVPANPFMRTSLAESSEAAVEAFNNSLRDAVDKGII
jgi:HK97 gp10 family phage protein